MAVTKTREEIIDWLASYYSAYYDVHEQEGMEDPSLPLKLIFM